MLATVDHVCLLSDVYLVHAQLPDPKKIMVNEKPSSPDMLENKPNTEKQQPVGNIFDLSPPKNNFGFTGGLFSLGVSGGLRSFGNDALQGRLLNCGYNWLQLTGLLTNL